MAAAEKVAADARNAGCKDCCGKGRAADAHDASGWLGTLEKAWQLMLVMLVLGPAAEKGKWLMLMMLWDGWGGQKRCGS